MLFGVFSVLVAIHIEVLRKEAPVLATQSTCAPHGVTMSDIKGAWMTVPFFLMGVGEIYTQPTLMYFAYKQSPPSMRTLTAATSLFIGGVSTAIFSIMVQVLSAYVPNNL